MSQVDDRFGIAVIAVTRGGARLGGEIVASLGGEARLHVSARWLGEAPEGALPIQGSLAERIAELFSDVRAFIFVLATGAVVRILAPLLGSKQTDPAVLTIDERGRHVVALLGGHQAGANALAQAVADAVGAEPVVSTASDALGLPALDQVGKAEGWRIEAQPEALKQALAAVVAGAVPAIVQEAGSELPLLDLPPAWPRLDSLDALWRWPGPRLLITDRLVKAPPPDPDAPLIVYRPRTLVLGVGCSTGAPADEIEALARTTLREAGLAWESVCCVATIDRRFMEPGIVELRRRADVVGDGYSAEELAAVIDLPTPSNEVARYVGTPGVCEPAAILASDGGELIVPKRKSAHATVAVARRIEMALTGGQLWLVGIGPGPLDLMTVAARRAIRYADVVIGYSAYLDMVTPLVPERRRRPYALGEERQRAEEAIRLARLGWQVALVSSGDIGIYSMAGLVFELLEGMPALEVAVIPGVTAASSAAALLGAPLMLDFAAISLSDLLVPWEAIRRRLVAAAEGDLVVVLYNPASRRRRQPLAEALAILREHRSAETPVGLVREAYRPDQEVIVTTLGTLAAEDQIDMRTVVVVGCSRTALLDGRIVTRRGYLDGEDRP